MTTEEAVKIGDRKNMYSKTLFGRTLQGIMIQDDFSDTEEFSNLLDTNIFSDEDSDSNHTSVIVSASSRVEQDGSTSIGSSRITSVDKFGKNVVCLAKLTVTTHAANAAGSVGSFIRLQQNSSRFVKFGAFTDGSGSPDSYALVKFQDSGESSEQTLDFTPGAVDAIARWYAVEFTENHMRFYTREGDSGAWTKHGQLSVTGIDKFDVSLLTETENASDSYTDIFWSSFNVMTLDHWKLEQLEDQLELSEATAGSFGLMTGMPTGEFNRKVFWVDVDDGVDTQDGKTFGTARLTIDAGYNLLTAQKDEVLLVAGNAVTDESANTAGVEADAQNTHIFALDQGTVQVSNSNGAATACFTISADSVEISGFQSSEGTNTVEFIVSSSSNYSVIHDNIIHDGLENAVHLDGSGVFSRVYNNQIGDCTNDGIEVEGTDAKIYGNVIHNVGDIGIHLSAGTAHDNFIYNNIINGGASTTTTGITIASGADDNHIDWNSITQCSNVMSDSGTNNGWGQYNSFDEITGSFNIVAGDSTNETNKITAQDLPASGKYAIQLDIQTLDTANEGSNIDFFAFTKIDNTNLRKVGTTRFIEGVDSIMGPIEFHAKGGDSVFQLASQVSTAVTGDRAVPFKIVKVT